jgi:hypothetical protein
MTAEQEMTAGAVSHQAMNWHDNRWDKVHREVRRLQVRIVKGKQDVILLNRVLPRGV